MLCKKGMEFPVSTTDIVKVARNLLSEHCPEFTLDVLKENFERNIIERVHSSFAVGTDTENVKQQNMQHFGSWVTEVIANAMILPAGILRVWDEMAVYARSDPVAALVLAEIVLECRTYLEEMPEFQPLLREQSVTEKVQKVYEIVKTQLKKGNLKVATSVNVCMFETLVERVWSNNFQR
jgi:hypothetical protein